MVIQDFQKIGFIQRPDCLGGFIVIHQDDLDSRRIEKIALPADAHITAGIIGHDEFVAFFTQDPIENVADARGRLKPGNFRVGCTVAGKIQNVADAGILLFEMRPDQVKEEVKQAAPVDQAKWRAVRIHQWGNPTGARGHRPGLVAYSLTFKTSARYDGQP